MWLINEGCGIGTQPSGANALGCYSDGFLKRLYPSLWSDLSGGGRGRQARRRVPGVKSLLRASENLSRRWDEEVSFHRLVKDKDCFLLCP